MDNIEGLRHTTLKKACSHGMELRMGSNNQARPLGSVASEHLFNRASCLNICLILIYFILFISLYSSSSCRVDYYLQNNFSDSITKYCVYTISAFFFSI